MDLRDASWLYDWRQLACALGSEAVWPSPADGPAGTAWAGGPVLEALLALLRSMPPLSKPLRALPPGGDAAPYAYCCLSLNTARAAVQATRCALRVGGHVAAAELAARAELRAAQQQGLTAYLELVPRLGSLLPASAVLWTGPKPAGEAEGHWELLQLNHRNALSDTLLLLQMEGVDGLLKGGPAVACAGQLAAAAEACLRLSNQAEALTAPLHGSAAGLWNLIIQVRSTGHVTGTRLLA